MTQQVHGKKGFVDLRPLCGGDDCDSFADIVEHGGRLVLCATCYKEEKGE